MAKKKSKSFSLILNGKFDYALLIVTVVLVCFGLIMMLSASSPTSISETGKSTKYLIRQGRIVIIGIAIMFILSKIDYKIYRKLSLPLYFGCLGILILVGFVGTAEGGARRWINIGGFFSLQPSEFVKVGIALIYAEILTSLKEKGKIRHWFWGYVFPLMLFIPFMYAVFILQNHFSATLIMAAIICVEMFACGSLLRYFIATGCAGVGAIALYIMKKSTSASSEDGGFRLERIQSWLNIESDVTGKGWQINQSLYAIGSGGLFGVGLGNSNQKYLYIPEPHNDFIFAVLAEELGFVGCVFVILLFAMFVWRGIVISVKSEDTYGTLVAIGLTTMIGLQALINVAVVTNTIPVTGMPLPFFSYGGSAMLADLIAVGILLSISRNSKKS